MMRNQQVYQSFQNVRDKVYAVLKENNAIAFHQQFTPDSSKLHLFAASFQDPKMPHLLENKYYQIKWESSPSYLTIGREVPELADATEGGKTISEKVLYAISHLPGLSLIFSDPYAIRIIDYDFFMINSYPFTQNTNGEKVRGIDIRKLVDIDTYFQRLKKF